MSDLALGDAICRLRVSRNISQPQLAAKSGVHRNTISRIEKGSYNPSVLMIRQIAWALNLEASKLFRYAEHLAPRMVQKIVIEDELVDSSS
jgi:putative transcriptional regulator